MKIKTLIPRLLLLTLIPLMAFKREKCKSDLIFEQAVKKLSKYDLIKDYRVYLKKNSKNDPDGYAYYTITLNRDVKYKFIALSSPEYEGKLIINLYNNPKREFLFATTSYIQGTVKESLEFQCQSTGNYTIGFYFADGKEGCGVAVSGFLK